MPVVRFVYMMRNENSEDEKEDKEEEKEFSTECWRFQKIKKLAVLRFLKFFKRVNKKTLPRTCKDKRDHSLKTITYTYEIRR